MLSLSIRNRVRGLARPTAASLIGLLLLAPAAPAAPTRPGPIPAERLVFLLQYIALDYGLAVEEGEIASPFEYEEMLRFSQLLVDESEALRSRGASAETGAGLSELRERIRDRRPWDGVRELATALAAELAAELDLVTLPASTPDVERGRRFYLRTCAACHGLRGRGDGPSAAEQEPPPTAFDGPRMNRVTPHQVVGAVEFGIEGTAMPAFGASLDRAKLWDIAFFVMTLRSGFAPHPPELPLPITLADLAGRSNEELLAAAQEVDASAHPAYIDHLRATPAEAQGPVVPRSAVAVDPTPRVVLDPQSDLEVALRLQGAFAAVAEAVAPSVVGVTGLVRSDASPTSDAGPGAWREGSVEERLYPGLRPARSGSGFFVSADGRILTAQRLLIDESDQPVEAVDIELHDGRHRTARIVATEPTIDLAVVALEESQWAPTPKLNPVRIGESDRVRVGHWVIALGNPPGPGRTFAVGTLSSPPERQCYQGDLTATLMQTSLDVPMGGHGGPLLNIEGDVVGMMVPGPGVDLAALFASERELRSALPMDLAMAIYEPLVRSETNRSPWLGFSVLELDAAPARRVDGSDGSPQTGVYIDDVFDPSPASVAGIRVGDALLAIDGNRLDSVGAFQRWLYRSGIGREIALSIWRGGEILERRVVVEERPAAVAPR
jgi:S1-C subfamily serine protease/mono/diheme cytochrome c family protein